MQFVFDPLISLKISRMKERVRWQDPRIVKKSIDQTRMAIDDGFSDNPEFSFLVIGDTGSGPHPDHHPQRKIAELMIPHLDRSRFTLHTGDVMYHVGSSEYYSDNFIYPYRELLVGGEEPKKISYDKMVFKIPFLSVLGNHDYYDLPLIYAFLAQATWAIRHLLRQKLNLGIGWRGSDKGNVYAKAFIDYLQDYSDRDLETHLDNHYTVKTNSGLCLCYKPGHFTRLPNRYYTFNYGGVDFFALDSNTFNSPSALPKTKEGENRRQELISRHQSLEHSREEIIQASAKLDPNRTEDAEILDDYQGQINQIDETLLDIEKQLKSHQNNIDVEQLDWLRDKLIESWNDPNVRGRVIFLHHPPYVTEATKWNQGQTIEVRRRLRQVFDAVAAKVGKFTKERPIVNLVLTGHAHCLEHLQTGDTGHADSYIHWVICGGSGHSLRRQRSEGIILTEKLDGDIKEVARSLLFVGRSGQASNKRKSYSFLRIDVQPGHPPKFILHPFVAQRYHHEWIEQELEPFII
jgi:Calcineurin-like phosphoesterase